MWKRPLADCQLWKFGLRSTWTHYVYVYFSGRSSVISQQTGVNNYPRCVLLWSWKWFVAPPVVTWQIAHARNMDQSEVKKIITFLLSIFFTWSWTFIPYLLFYFFSTWSSKSFTFFSNPCALNFFSTQVGKVFTFSQPVCFTFSPPEVWKQSCFYFFIFSKPENTKLL